MKNTNDQHNTQELDFEKARTYLTTKDIIELTTGVAFENSELLAEKFFNINEEIKRDNASFTQLLSDEFAGKMIRDAYPHIPEHVMKHLYTDGKNNDIGSKVSTKIEKYIVAANYNIN